MMQYVQKHPAGNVRSCLSYPLGKVLNFKPGKHRKMATENGNAECFMESLCKKQGESTILQVSEFEVAARFGLRAPGTARNIFSS